MHSIDWCNDSWYVTMIHIFYTFELYNLKILAGSTNVVKALLEKGADPYVVTKAGNDPLMCACIAGRLKNVTFFMNYFYGKWNINRRNKLGGNSLGCTVYMGGGKDRLKLVKFLINQGADVDSVTDNGTSNIISACANEDASIDVLQTLIDESSNPDMINLQIRPRTITWKIIYSIANMLVKTGINHSSLLQSLSARRGRTALHYAAKRGDLSIVELLLSTLNMSFSKNASLFTRIYKTRFTKTQVFFFFFFFFFFWCRSQSSYKR